MAEIDYFAALGVEAPKTVSEPAASEAADKSEPVDLPDEKQEAAAPEISADISDSAQDISAPVKRKQSREEDSKYAAARRKAERERDEALAKVEKNSRMAADAAISEIMSKIKIRNPMTGKIVTSKAEYEQIVKDIDAQKELDTAQTLKNAVETHPDVVSARQAIESAEHVQEEALDARAVMAAQKQIGQIAAIDPEIQTLSDLRKMPDYDRLYNLVQKGNSIYEAFWAVRGEKLLSGRESGAAKQAAINAVSKGHLTRSDSHGDSEAIATSKDIESFRAMFPSMSKKEIAEYAARYTKNTKKAN